MVVSPRFYSQETSKFSFCHLPFLIFHFANKSVLAVLIDEDRRV
jgi:hypothetical protein